jgi:hypothetical protein
MHGLKAIVMTSISWNKMLQMVAKKLLIFMPGGILMLIFHWPEAVVV